MASVLRADRCESFPPAGTKRGTWLPDPENLRSRAAVQRRPSDRRRWVGQRHRGALLIALGGSTDLPCFPRGVYIHSASMGTRKLKGLHDRVLVNPRLSTTCIPVHPAGDIVVFKGARRGTYPAQIPKDPRGKRVVGLPANPSKGRERGTAT